MSLKYEPSSEPLRYLPTASERRGGNLNGCKDVRAENGSSQGQNPALTGLAVPSSVKHGHLYRCTGTDAKSANVHLLQKDHQFKLTVHLPLNVLNDEPHSTRIELDVTEVDAAHFRRPAAERFGTHKPVTAVV